MHWETLAYSRPFPQEPGASLGTAYRNKPLDRRDRSQGPYRREGLFGPPPTFVPILRAAGDDESVMLDHVGDQSVNRTRLMALARPRQTGESGRNMQSIPR